MSFSFSSVNTNYRKFTSVATITSSVTISNTTPSTIVVSGNSSIVNITIPSSINVGSKFTITSNYSLGDNISYPDQRATFVKTSSDGNIARLRFNDQVTVTALQSNPTQPRHFASKIVRKAVSSSITKWTTRASAVSNSWCGNTWSPELGIFCCVARTGTGNRVMTSPDGITWTSRTSAADNDWNSVTWSPELGLFCAVSDTGTGNRVMTSPDGITWTSRTSAADNSWNSVTWASDLGIFCAVSYTGTSNNAMTSPDGITWTTRAAPSLTFQQIIWSPQLGIFCATTIDPSIATSPDGTTWTTRSLSGGRAIDWSPELGIMVVVGDNTLLSSPDGINWTTRGPTSISWSTVKWSSKLGFFLAASSSSLTGTSRDGIQWTTRNNMGSISGTVNRSMSWSPELNLFVGVNSGSGDSLSINTW